MRHFFRKHKDLLEAGSIYTFTCLYTTFASLEEEEEIAKMVDYA